MAKFKGFVSVGLVGCKKEFEFEVDDRDLADCMTSGDREELINEVFEQVKMDYVNWWWEEAE